MSDTTMFNTAMALIYMAISYAQYRYYAGLGRIYREQLRRARSDRDAAYEKITELNGKITELNGKINRVCELHKESEQVMTSAQDAFNAVLTQRDKAIAEVERLSQRLSYADRLAEYGCAAADSLASIPFPCSDIQILRKVYRDLLVDESMRQTAEREILQDTAATANVSVKPQTDTPSPACHAGQDGDCTWDQCPQLRNNEPLTSGRHCPHDN